MGGYLSVSTVLLRQLERLQAKLDFQGAVSPPFVDENGAGRHGVAGLAVGVTFGFSSCMLLLGPSAGMSTATLQWFAYVLLLAVFHASEWYVTAAYRPRELGYKSWIINHSLAYTVVQICSLIEFWVEWALVPSIKGIWWLIIPGFLVSVVAITVRVLGMVHCGENFDHVVMQTRKEGHNLVTDGIYQYLRHPSYFGFYYWSVAAQLLLGNPILTIGCAYVSCKFFIDRIGPEEEVLVKCYGDEYKTFAERTPIGIPFVKGYVPYSGRTNSKAD